MLPFVRRAAARCRQKPMTSRAWRSCRGVAAPLVALVASASCYDWTVRDGAAAAVDGSSNVDAAPNEDASIDGGAHDAASGDATPVADASCDALGAALATATEKARACNFPETCPTALTDECGCRRFGSKSPSSPDIVGYAAAVSRFLSAGCTATCFGICQPPIDAGVCLQQGGPKTYCSP